MERITEARSMPRAVPVSTTPDSHALGVTAVGADGIGIGSGSAVGGQVFEDSGGGSDIGRIDLKGRRVGRCFRFGLRHVDAGSVQIGGGQPEQFDAGLIIILGMELRFQAKETGAKQTDDGSVLGRHARAQT